MQLQGTFTSNLIVSWQDRQCTASCLVVHEASPQLLTLSACSVIQCCKDCNLGLQCFVMLYHQYRSQIESQIRGLSPWGCRYWYASPRKTCHASLHKEPSQFWLQMIVQCTDDPCRHQILETLSQALRLSLMICQSLQVHLYQPHDTGLRIC